VIEAATGVLNDAYDESVAANDLVANADSRIAEVSDLAAAGKGEVKEVGEILHNALDAIDKRTKGDSDRIKTGLCGIDRIIVGLKKTQVAVIGARPGQGKTSLLLRLAYNMATGPKPLRVLFFSLEMSEEDLAERMLSMIGKVNSWKMQAGRVTPADRTDIVEAAARLSASSLLISDPGTITVSQIGARCRTYARKIKGGIDVLVIDYVQLIAEESAWGKESRQQKLGRITRRLKQIAKDQGVLVLTAAQLNRDVDKSGREPRLSDLREAGDIENDADVVILCHMPGAENDKKRADIAEHGEECKLLVRKNRNGPNGETDMFYFRAFSLWGDTDANVAKYAEPPPAPRFSEFDEYNQEAGDDYGRF
jgi:replicative DNA helicase